MAIMRKRFENPKRHNQNVLYYGDNLDVLRSGRIKGDSVDLCYIDPPFNSKRNYNQIYNAIGKEDIAQAQAFIDTWIWNDLAQEHYDEIQVNHQGRFTSQTVDLIQGLHHVLKEDSLMAYLVAMAVRINEIQRILKETGLFYLHCDPTAGHYLKLVCDSIFIPRGGDFRNEIVWCYSGGGIPKRDFPRKHDTILRYSKSDDYYYKPEFRQYTAGTLQRGRTAIKGKYFDEGLRKEGTPVTDWWADVPKITSPTDPEKLGYPTQKSEALMRRIIETSSREGDLVLDAFCGCGTTIAVAEKLKRQWIGIDITYQAISVMLKRLRETFGNDLSDIMLDGIPRDMESARALANRADDRVRKEFEKWAVLTYSNNYAAINEKKGADKGIDGLAFFVTGKQNSGRVVFQVKSGGANRGTIATLNSDRQREKAEIGILIVLDEPSAPMKKEAVAVGTYRSDLMNHSVNRIQIVTVEEILEGKRLDLPMTIAVLRQARAAMRDGQLDLLDAT